MIVSVIFAVLLAAAISCYVSGAVKRIRLLEIIPFSLCIPFMAGVACPLLIISLPDSHHILSISSMAVFFAEIMILLKIFKPFKTNIFEKLALCLSLTFWILIFKSIFNIYRCHIAINIIFTALWILFFLFLMIKTHLKKLFEIFESLILTVFSMSLFYICLVSIIYGHTLDTLFCFLGCSSFVLYTGFNIFDSKAENPKFLMLENILLLLGTFFMYSGTVLMHFN